MTDHPLLDDHSQRLAVQHFPPYDPSRSGSIARPLTLSGNLGSYPYLLQTSYPELNYYAGIRFLGMERDCVVGLPPGSIDLQVLAQVSLTNLNTPPGHGVTAACIAALPMPLLSAELRVRLGLSVLTNLDLRWELTPPAGH